jgi:hypothetical protein
MGSEVMLGQPLGGPLGGALGLRPAAPGIVAAPSVRLLAVGGGGAGLRAPFAPWWRGCTGGAGGQVIELDLVVPVGVYPVTIGLGGVVYSGQPFGLPTQFGALLWALGGGGGAIDDGTKQMNGSGFNATGELMGAVYPRAMGGFLGGAAWSDFSGYSAGPGGGGAGGPGGNASSTAAGAPGPGRVSSISGAPVEYGRGGEGGRTGREGDPASGPGGGGGGAIPGNSTGGRPGNAGILILSYQTGTQTWLGGDVTQAGNRTIHTLTANGTLTRTA